MKNPKLQNPYKTFKKTFNDIEEFRRFVFDYYAEGSDRYTVYFDADVHRRTANSIPIILRNIDGWQWFIGRVARTQITPPLFEADLLEVGKLITI